MDYETYERRMRIIRRGVLAIIPAFLIAVGIQWALGVCDISPKAIWFKSLFLALTLLFWAPWHKTKPPPKNQGNNDLFPGQ
jgi:hypothetical protein